MGYALTQFPAGWAATKLSPKRLIIFSATLTFVASALSPTIARFGWGYLIATQVIKGLASGIFYPALQMAMASWMPPDERSRMVALCYTGSPVGTLIGFVSAGVLCVEGFAGGWPSVFYVYAIVGFAWLIFFIILVHDNPAVHPFISERERTYIEDSLASEIAFDKKKQENIPWKSIFTSTPLLAIVIAEMAYCWLWFSALTTLPIYMNDVLKFSVKKNGLASSMPYIANLFVALTSSYIADLMIQMKLMSITYVRKMCVSCAMLLPAVFIVTAGFLNPHNPDPYLAVLLISLAVGCLAFARSGITANLIDIAPRYSSVLMGIDNTLCSVTGFIAPIVPGFMAPNGTQEEWRNIFFLAASISVFAEIIYLIFGTGEVQPWAKESNIYTCGSSPISGESNEESNQQEAPLVSSSRRKKRERNPKV